MWINVHCNQLSLHVICKMTPFHDSNKLKCYSFMITSYIKGNVTDTRFSLTSSTVSVFLEPASHLVSLVGTSCSQDLQLRPSQAGWISDRPRKSRPTHTGVRCTHPHWITIIHSKVHLSFSWGVGSGPGTVRHRDENQQEDLHRTVSAGREEVRSWLMKSTAEGWCYIPTLSSWSVTF